MVRGSQLVNSLRHIYFDTKSHVSGYRMIFIGQTCPGYNAAQSILIPPLSSFRSADSQAFRHNLVVSCQVTSVLDTHGGEKLYNIPSGELVQISQ